LQIKKIKSSNSNTEKFCKIAIFLFPIFFITLIVSNKILFGPFNESYLSLIHEDGIIESATSIFYFISCLLSIIIGRNFIKSKNNFSALLFFLFSATFFGIAMEEISWGQRILNLETTEFFSENIQNETNFHNLPIIQYVDNILFPIVGLFGSFSWLFLSKLKNKLSLRFFIPNRYFMSYFLPTFLFYGKGPIKNFIPQSSEGFWFFLFSWKDQEVIEFLLAMGIFLFVLSKILEWKTNFPQISK